MVHVLEVDKNLKFTFTFYNVSDNDMKSFDCAQKFLHPRKWKTEKKKKFNYFKVWKQKKKRHEQFFK